MADVGFDQIVYTLQSIRGKPYTGDASAWLAQHLANPNPHPQYQLITENEGTFFTGQAYVIWTGTGLTFDVIWPVYYLDGVAFPAGSDQITLDAADVTDPRLDVIGVDSTGAIKVTGTPSANPEKPTVDPLTELEITVILIEAGETTPEITDVVVYDENTETTVTSNNVTLNANNTTDPFNGAKHVSLGSFNNLHRVDFTFASEQSIVDLSVARFYLKLLSAFASGTYLRISFYDGSLLISSVVNVINGAYNFNRTNVSGYQIISVPFSEFTFSQSAFTKIRISFAGTNSSGFRLDYFTLQTGESTASPLQNTITNVLTDSGTASANQANDTLQLLGLEGTIVLASGKIIRVKALPLVIAAGTDTYTGTLTGLTLALGVAFKLLIPNNNTGASTFNLNGSGAVPLKKNVTTALAADDVKADGIYIVIYDGTNLQVIGLGGSGGGGTGDVVGPASALNNSVVLYDGTTGKLLKDSGKVLTTVGGNILALTNPSAITWLRLNADNTVTSRTAAQTLTDLYAGWTSDSTPLDTDEVFGYDPISAFSIRTTWTNIKAFLVTYFNGLYQALSGKDATGGYVGLTLFKINFKNVANTFTSFFTNSNTAARTYTFQNRDGTIADDTDLALKAPLASPALTGTPTTPTAAANTNNTQIASTAYVDAAVDAASNAGADIYLALNFN